ncbi:MAG: rod shape-determining protein MreD [Caryophanon sp.]|nr:rod shape-determining protein MreD [Caryophanon sp.]
MIVRLLIPFIALLLFFLESNFALFSPLEFNERTVYLVPRFLFLYLVFISVYYDRKRAIQYGLVFGILFDVFYLNLIGLYTVLYPLVCIIAGSTVRYMHQHLATTIALAIGLMGIFEFVLYQFFYFISYTSMPLDVFFYDRLLPTIGANLLFLLMLGWIFKYLISARLLQRVE